MSLKVMLAPNPGRSTSIERVIVLGKTSDQQRLMVLNIDALRRDPALTQAYRSEGICTAAFWSSIGAALILSSVALSFFWHWWATIAGVALAALIIKATRRDGPTSTSRYWHLTTEQSLSWRSRG